VTKLSILEAEARRVLGRRLRRGIQPLRESLVALCQEHWPEIRGPQLDGTLIRGLSWPSSALMAAGVPAD
jgi:hypothetical protein